MKKGLPTAILILSWAIITGLLLDSFSVFSVNNDGLLAIGLSLSYLTIGSFIFLQLINQPFSDSFVYLTTSLAFSSLLLHANLPIYYGLRRFFLMSFPIFTFVLSLCFYPIKSSHETDEALGSSCTPWWLRCLLFFYQSMDSANITSFLSFFSRPLTTNDSTRKTIVFWSIHVSVITYRSRC